MVISKVDDKSENNNSRKEDQKLRTKSPAKINKIYTCGEIEAINRSKTAKKKFKKNANQHSIKDPAIMQFAVRSPYTKMRYEIDELKNLKSSRLSQSPPPCLYNPQVIKLNILKYTKDHPEYYENQMKSFRELLPQLSVSSWDPTMVDLLNTYHRNLLCPKFDFTDNSYNSSKMPRENNTSYSSNRRVSWSDQRQIESRYDNLPPYEQKNFFDSITTATTMRPPAPPQAKLGGMNSSMKYRNQQMYRSGKVASCATSKFSGNASNLSTGSFSVNDTRSSYDESMNTTSSDKSEMDIFKPQEKLKENDDVNNEPEPEWFSCPASRHDFVDLCGFEDDEGFRDLSSENERPGSRNSVTKFVDEFSSACKINGNMNRRPNFHQQQRPQRNFNMRNNAYQHHQPQQQQFFNPMQHLSSSSSSYNSSLEQNDFNNNYNNSFFDMLKYKPQPQFNHNVNVGYPKPRTMMTIADVEEAMKNAKNLINRQPQQINGVVQQLFLNAANPSFNRLSMPAAMNYQTPQHAPTFQPRVDSFPPGSLPSQEQLQQHTSEILRNAILRKHYNNEPK